MTSYPNIEALSQGCISGSSSEWTWLQPEAKAILAENVALRAILSQIHEALEQPKGSDDAALPGIVKGLLTHIRGGMVEPDWLQPARVLIVVSGGVASDLASGRVVTRLLDWDNVKEGDVCDLEEEFLALLDLEDRAELAEYNAENSKSFSPFEEDVDDNPFETEEDA